MTYYIKKIFESKCPVNGKVCMLMIDNNSYENFVSNILVEYFKVETKPYPTPYSIDLI